MCFPRNPSLGHYNATRSEWQKAYRFARTLHRNGMAVPASYSGVTWKAGLIVDQGRDAPDPLTIPAADRLALQHLINEIVAEDKAK